MNDQDFMPEIDPEANLLNNLYAQLQTDNQSNYFSVCDFNSVFRENRNSFAVCNYNIRSFNANNDMFFSFLHSLNIKFDVIALTETRFACGSGLSVEGLAGHHSGRVNGGGGGVSVYCSLGLPIKKIEELSFVNDTIETCTVLINLSPVPIAIVAIYRPPPH